MQRQQSNRQDLGHCSGTSDTGILKGFFIWLAAAIFLLSATPAFAVWGVNGGFETGDLSSWTASSTPAGAYPVVQNTTVSSGTYAVSMSHPAPVPVDGYISSIEQDILIPANETEVWLTLDYLVVGDDSEGFDGLEVYINDEIQAEWFEDSGGWQKFYMNLTRYIGTTITLKIEAYAVDDWVDPIDPTFGLVDYYVDNIYLVRLFDLTADVTSGTGTGTVISDLSGKTGTLDCPTTLCSDKFLELTQVTLTASAAPNNYFTGWSVTGAGGDTGECTTGNPPDCQVLINQDKTVTASFCLDDDNDTICNINDQCPGFNDLIDTDGDGKPNGNPTGAVQAGTSCDDDDDNDGVTDAVELAAGIYGDTLDPYKCQDLDGDTCNDCIIGVDQFGANPDNTPNNDGPDNDGDGLCDAGDPDDDNDGVIDTSDADSFDPDICRDLDGDSCDDCAVGTDNFGPLVDFNVSNDGLDTDSDGICNAGDPDDEN